MKLTAEQRIEQMANYQTHDVPRAGTLDQISYCRKCGTAFDHARLAPCPGTRQPGKRDGHDR